MKPKSKNFHDFSSPAVNTKLGSYQSVASTYSVSCDVSHYVRCSGSSTNKLRTISRSTYRISRFVCFDNPDGLCSELTIVISIPPPPFTSFTFPIAQ
nr:hypothetical protein HmN_000296100 [Hymenolepis microstoma]